MITITENPSFEIRLTAGKLLRAARGLPTELVPTVLDALRTVKDAHDTVVISAHSRAWAESWKKHLEEALRE